MRQELGGGESTGEEESEGLGRVSAEAAVSAGRPSRHQSLTRLGVCSVARPRLRGSWPRPGPHPSSFQPPSGDARSTCNCLSHARLQRWARALPSGTGSWEAESPGTHPGSCPAAAQVRSACFLVVCGQGCRLYAGSDYPASWPPVVGSSRALSLHAVPPPCALGQDGGA